MPVESMDFHIVPSVNPDGFERATEGHCEGQDFESGRTNADDVDLNRDFPGWDELELSRKELFSGRARETRVLMKYILDNPFVLSLNYHDGSVVASYAFDDAKNKLAPAGAISKTPDHDFWLMAANSYASKNERMSSGKGSCRGENFKNGVTNGAQWYVVTGGMQDFNYLYSNCYEMTVELSCCKYPEVDMLKVEWTRNIRSLISYFKLVHSSACGIVTGNGDPVAGASIQVDGIDHDVTTTERGEFWRLLVPGSSYRLRAVLVNRKSRFIRVDIPTSPTACTRIDFDFN